MIRSRCGKITRPNRITRYDYSFANEQLFSEDVVCSKSNPKKIGVVQWVPWEEDEGDDEEEGIFSLDSDDEDDEDEPSFGMVSIGLTYTSFDSDWFQVFLGAMLLMAVLFNNFIRRKVTGER